MRKRTLRTLLVTAVASAFMAAMAVPAHANVGASDAACDVIDPVLGLHEDQDGVGSPVPPYHTCDAPEADLVNAAGTPIGSGKSWNSRSASIGGRPGIKAYFKVNTALPEVGRDAAEGGPTAPRTKPYPSFNGYTFHNNFQNAAVQDNNPPAHITGMRAPLCTTPIYASNTGHWQDHYWFQIGVSLTFAGGEYKATPFISQYDPNIDGGFFFHDFNANPLLTPGTDYTWGFVTAAGAESPATWDSVENEWEHFSPTSTIYVNVPTKFPSPSTVACGGFITQTFADTGHIIKDNWGATWLNQVVVLPVPIPLSLVPGESDIDAIGGFIYRSDWSPDSALDLFPTDVDGPGGVPAVPAIGPEELGTVNVPGPTCWTPTVGGLLPSNPLHTPNQPCGIDNPAGPGYTPSGLSYTL
jgi:hypothetical protein